MLKIPHDPDEILAIVDDNDNVIGKVKRKDAHLKGILHREVYVFLINSNNQVLLQKRAVAPQWDCSASGHFPYYYNYIDGAIKEFHEELGIKLSKEDLIFLKKDKRIENYEIKGVIKKNNRFCSIFLVRKDIPLEKCNIEKQEVAGVRYFNLKTLKVAMLAPKSFTKPVYFFLKNYILPILSS